MHNIEYYEYNENVDKKKVQRQLDEYVAYEDRGEGSSGLVNGIRWIDKEFDCREDAEEYIEENDKGWYDCLAVKFKAPSDKETKTSKDLTKRIIETREKLSTLQTDTLKRIKEKDFVSCKYCGSKINTKYVDSYLVCRLCHNSFHSDTSKNRIKGYEDKISDLKLKLSKERCKQGKLMWLVKIEYHT